MAKEIAISSVEFTSRQYMRLVRALKVELRPSEDDSDLAEQVLAVAEGAPTQTETRRLVVYIRRIRW
jgi:hypothetical protein